MTTQSTSSGTSTAPEPSAGAGNARITGSASGRFLSQCVLEP
jgi:hypothetical protein